MAGSDGRAESEATRADNALSGTVHGPSVQAAAIHGNVYFGADARQGPSSWRAPRQLPPEPRHFTDRAPAVAALDAARDSAVETAVPTLAVISGPPGVGKTSLALAWLYRHRAAFPDGQLYVDLRGHDADRPVSPSTILPGFLRACGVPPDQVPADLAEQTALFRTVTGERRIAVLCDNALSAAQVRALMPTTPGSVCLVTSRWRLASLVLDGAHFLSLDPLDADAAVQLLARIAGRERIAADYPAAHDLVAFCGRFPLAVCVSAALLAVRPGWSVGSVTVDLVLGSRLVPTEGELSMNACLDQACAAVGPDAARLYRRLGTHPGPDFDLGVARALARAEPVVPDADQALESLVAANLLTVPSPDRYHVHDLIQRHARACAERDDPPALREDCVRRIADHYLATANSADAVLYPQRRRPEPVYAAPVHTPRTFADQGSALAWFDAEHRNLVDVQRLADDHGLASVTWQLADAMWGLFSYLRYHDDWIATHEVGANAARRCGHLLGEARLRNGLGVALREAGRAEEALRVFDDAVALRRDLGDRRGEALVLHHMALTHQARDDLDRARTLLEQALTLQEEAGSPRDQARSMAALGEVDSLTGRHERAIERLVRAHAMVTGTRDRSETTIERLLGSAYLRSGDNAAARRHFVALLRLLEGTGTVFDEGLVHEELGRIDEQEGRQAAAREHYERAAAVYGRLGATADADRAAELRGRLGPPAAGV